MPPIAPATIPSLHSTTTNHILIKCSSLIAVDALAHVKKGLRSLFSRRKKKKPPKQPEPTPCSNEAPTHTTAAAAAAAAATPVEAPATSNRSIDEAEDATETGSSLFPCPETPRQTRELTMFSQDGTLLHHRTPQQRLHPQQPPP